ncbi:insulin-like growth factor-binding protein complex acid labile subunit [Culicoides brevitarsis]|uniref:insulin-like growth factor-binding protein complex acid labile subunit n=1 Tax=Culicoides brevitarsis TaxID=469753 RepID=UPI00307B9417
MFFNNLNFKWITLIVILHLMESGTANMRKCPEECTCMEDHDRYVTMCYQGNMTSIPTDDIDPNVDVIEIIGPKNDLIIGPIFTVFKKLEVLRIIDSNVPAIGTHSLWGLKSLRILDLKNNNITQLSDDNFRGQDNLVELDLSGNKLERFPSAVFQYLTGLKILNLSENFIQELVQRMFFKLSKLTYLDLSGNPLDLLPPDVFRDVQDLKVLKCRRCQLNKINPQLYNLLRNLVELDLGENQFQYFETSEFNDLKKLKKLYLDHNELPVIVNKLFLSQRSLEVLDFSHNRLARIPEMAFQNLNNLTFLDVSYNKMKIIEENCFRPLVNLHTLNISGNIHLEFDLLQNELEVLQHLKTLSMADMGATMTLLPINIPHLRNLNLSGNSLNSDSLNLIDFLEDLDNLELDLSRNQFSEIDTKYVDRISSIKDVKLDLNPIVCDNCHMGALINRSKELPWKSIPICFLPENLRGNSINSLDAYILDDCIDFDMYENNNAASSSLNFIEQVLIGNMNWFALSAAVLIAVIAIIFLLFSVFYGNQQRTYYTNESRESVEENANGEITEDCKVPLNDNSICTIQEKCQPLSLLSHNDSNYPQSSYYYH